MKKAIMGGKMVQRQRQTDKVLGLFCAWNPGHDIPLQQSHLGYASNPLTYTEQVNDEPEFERCGVFYGEIVTQDMTTAERQIWEAGMVTRDRKVLLSHDNVTAAGTGFWFHKSRQIQKWIGKCTEVEAQDMSSICKVLEATESMVREFCRWAHVKGINACLKYLETFVDLSTEKPELNGLDNPDENVFEQYDYSFVEADENYYSGEVPMYQDTRFNWNWEPDISEIRQQAPATDWHVVRHYKLAGLETQEICLGDNEPDWIQSQSKEYRQMVDKIKKCQSQDELNNLTKTVQKGRCSVVQGRTLHSYIRAAKKRLNKLSLLAQTIIDRIKRCSKERLGYEAKKLYGMIQDGRVKLSVSDQQKVWKVYRTTKKKLNDMDTGPVLGKNEHGDWGGVPQQ